MYLICPSAKIVILSRLAQKAKRLDNKWWNDKSHARFVKEDRTHLETTLNEQMYDHARALKYAVNGLRTNMYVETILTELHEALALILNQNSWTESEHEGYTDHLHKTAGLALAFAHAMSIHHVVNNETEACEDCQDLAPMTDNQNKTFIDLVTTLNPPTKQAP